jgi:3-hydroxyisobutyrate dehydrogenase-like beta-hydroxyacid dehydrogenase
MAGNLLKAGYRLRVWNRSPGKAQPLVARGAVLAPDPAGTADAGGVVVTMLTNDEAVEQVTLGTAGLLGRLGPGGVHLSMSTISPAMARRLAELHTERGSHYVAAPVFGRPNAAEAAKLVACVSGSDLAVRNRVRPLLEAMGQKVFDFGDDAGAAHVIKLTGNFLVASAIEAMGEAFTLAQKNGIAREQIYDLFSTTLFDCPVYRLYGKLVAEERYDQAGAPLSLSHKDIGMVLGAAREALVPMPLANVVFNHVTAAMARGQGAMDWAGFAREISRNAGL